ncbi:MAG TPA: hypothetical protein VGG36_02005 [Rhizomicrobium sp.]|jgi:hypothetical protein
MTKDGRPSRINDIRYFFGDTHRYLENHHDVFAFGNRIAWFLNGEDFSLGAYPSLYIYLTPTLRPGAVEVTNRGGDWWQHYTNVGVPEDFPNRSDSAELVMAGTVAALKAIRPDCAAVIDRAATAVRTHGNDLRFLLKTRETKRFTMEVSFTIAVWPQPSLLFVSLVERASGAFLEAPPTELLVYFEAFDLAGSIRVSEKNTALIANKSVAATLMALRHGGPLVKSISEFSPAQRPLYSRLVKRR